MLAEVEEEDFRIAFIPARGGSKRIPRKNIKDFAGQPMIAWPIRAAMSTKKFQSIVVSTDDPEIAEIASQVGAQVVYRNPDLADDYTHTTAVIKDFIQSDVAADLNPWIYKIYPTAPLTSKVVEAFLRFTESSPSGLTLTVAQSRNPVQRALVMNSQNVLKFREPGFAFTRTQDLEPTLFDAGKIYGGRKIDWLQTETPLLSAARGFLLPEWLSVDIDSPEDWEIAEIIFKRKSVEN